MKPDKMTTFATLMAVVVILSAVLGSAGTYALWNDRFGSSTVMISAGTADLEIFYNPAPVDALFPGETVEIPLTLINSGDVDLELDLAMGPGSSFWTQSILVDSPCGVVGEAFDAGALSNGESWEICLEITLDSNAPSSVQNELIFSNVVVNGDYEGWTASSSVEVPVQIGQISMDTEVSEALIGLLVADQIAVTNQSQVAVDATVEIRSWGLLDSLSVSESSVHCSAI